MLKSPPKDIQKLAQKIYKSGNQLLSITDQNSRQVNLQ